MEDEKIREIVEKTILSVHRLMKETFSENGINEVELYKEIYYNILMGLLTHFSYSYLKKENRKKFSDQVSDHIIKQYKIFDRNEKEK